MQNHLSSMVRFLRSAKPLVRGEQTMVVRYIFWYFSINYELEHILELKLTPLTDTFSQNPNLRITPLVIL
jgi:hypothetical protein